MAITKTKLYNGGVEVVFNSFGHKYTVDGKSVTNVTKATGIIAKPALINWAARMATEYMAEYLEPGKSYDELQLSAMFESAKKAHWQKKVDAGQAGTHVHNWVEKYINGENPGMPVSEKLQESI